MNHPPNVLLVPPPEAAKRLSISPRKLFDLTKRGEIRAVRIGRAVRYAVSELVAWIERQGGTDGQRPH